MDTPYSDARTHLNIHPSVIDSDLKIHTFRRHLVQTPTIIIIQLITLTILPLLSVFHVLFISCLIYTHAQQQQQQQQQLPALLHQNIQPASINRHTTYLKASSCRSQTL